jgi:hypothetical protein
MYIMSWQKKSASIFLALISRYARVAWKSQADATARIFLGEIKVACVMDEFTFHSYNPECQLFQLSPEHVVDELQAFNPDLLFIESAWRGKDNRWDRKIGTLSEELRAALQWCRERNIPSIFWNKEDPIHFETFLTTAQQFDYVFTTDIDCIARYKAALGHERVYLLPFACQPVFIILLSITSEKMHSVLPVHIMFVTRSGPRIWKHISKNFQNSSHWKFMIGILARMMSITSFRRLSAVYCGYAAFQ